MTKEYSGNDEHSQKKKKFVKSDTGNFNTISKVDDIKLETVSMWTLLEVNLYLWLGSAKLTIFYYLGSSK